MLSLEQSPGIFTTWYFGLPTSSAQTLIGGLVGAALASASTVHWMAGVVGKVIVPMILSPFVGFVGGYVDDGCCVRQIRTGSTAGSGSS
jgi:phosphate/sulfate permease